MEASLRKQFIQDNIGLAYAYASRHLPRRFPWRDRVSIASLGLCQAAKKIDPDGAAHSSYLIQGMKWAADQLFRDENKQKALREVPSIDGFAGHDLRQWSRWRNQERKQFDRLIDAVLHLPTLRHAFVVIAVYWEGRTLHDIGVEAGLTRERIRQLEEEALAFIKWDMVLRQEFLPRIEIPHLGKMRLRGFPTKRERMQNARSDQR